MLFSQVQTTLPPQFTEYPQQAFVQQTYQQQQQQQHLQAQQAFQQHQQLQLLMQQSGQHQHQYQPQPQQQQQQHQPFPSTQLPVLQQQVKTITYKHPEDTVILQVFRQIPAMQVYNNIL